MKPSCGNIFQWQHKKKVFLITLIALIGALQGICAQTSVMTESALRTETNIKLGTDITLTDGRLDINGTTVTLDLNGYTLRRPMTNADDGGQVIAVMNGGKLTITDTSANGNGKITGNSAVQKNGYYGYGGGGSDNALTNWDGTKKRNGWGIG